MDSNYVPQTSKTKATKSKGDSYLWFAFLVLIAFLAFLTLTQDDQNPPPQPFPCPNTCDRTVDILLTQDPIVVDQGGISLRGRVKNTIDLIPLESEVIFSTREISAFSLKKGDMAHFHCTFDNNGRRIYECDLVDTTITRTSDT